MAPIRMGLGVIELVVLLVVGFFVVRAISRNKGGVSAVLGVVIGVLSALFLGAILLYAVRSQSSSSAQRTAVLQAASQREAAERANEIAAAEQAIELERIEANGDFGRIEIDSGESGSVRITNAKKSTEKDSTGVVVQSGEPRKRRHQGREAIRNLRNAVNNALGEHPTWMSERPTWIFVPAAVTVLILLVLIFGRSRNRSGGGALGFVSIFILACIGGMLLFWTSARSVQSVRETEFGDGFPFNEPRIEDRAAPREAAKLEVAPSPTRPAEPAAVPETTHSTAPAVAAPAEPAPAATAPVASAPPSGESSAPLVRERPKWLETAPVKIDGVSLRTIVGNWQADYSAAERDRIPLIRKALLDYASVQFGDDAGAIELPAGNVNQWVDDEYIESSDEFNRAVEPNSPISRTDIPAGMYRLHVRVKVNSESNRILTDIVSQARDRARLAAEQSFIKERLGRLGLIVGSVLACLATALGYFKLDTLSKGYYTGRLRLGALAAILAIVAAAVLVS